MPYVFPPNDVTSIPVLGTGQSFPVRRVYCVGRNYADHAVEMGHDPNQEPPFFFQKNPDNIVTAGSIPYPNDTSDFQHEIELVVALASGGTNITVVDAPGCVFGYAVGLDMTRRDLQNEAKKLGRPWEVGKAFEHSAPCSPIAPATAIGHPDRGAIELRVNGKTVQSGNLDQMIWKVPEAIAHLSRFFRLAAGDIIMTGTPAGVGPVKRGDLLEGRIEHVGELRVAIV